MRNQWQQGKMTSGLSLMPALLVPKPGYKDFMFPQLPHLQVNTRHRLRHPAQQICIRNVYF